MTDLLIKDITNNIATLTVNRPEQRNALSPEMLQDISEFLAAVDANPEVRCLVIRGNGDNFIGGGDVSSFGPTLELTPDERQRVYEKRLINASLLYMRLERLQKPVVTITRGAVAGAGITFALASDLTIASDSTFFFFAQGALGLSLDGALSYYLPRIVGYRKARELALLNARVKADEALQLGMVSRVVPDDDLDAAADALIQRLANGATVSMGRTKSLLEASSRNAIEQQLRLEAESCGVCVATEDFAEGVSAFLDKRKAVFNGR